MPEGKSRTPNFRHRTLRSFLATYSHSSPGPFAPLLNVARAKKKKSKERAPPDSKGLRTEVPIIMRRTMLGARLHVAGAFRCSAPRVSAVTGAHIGGMSRGLSVRGLGMGAGELEITMDAALSHVQPVPLVNLNLNLNADDDSSVSGPEIVELAALTPKPHQEAAVKKALCHFGYAEDGGRSPGMRGPGSPGTTRARVVLPPGAGKTLVGLWVSEAFSGPILVVMPSLPLIDQTLASYGRYSHSVASGETKMLVAASKCALKASTTSADVIEKFLRESQGDKSIIFSTYHSLGRVGEALSKAQLQLDLAIFDEAHRMAGQGKMHGLGL